MSKQTLTYLSLVLIIVLVATITIVFNYQTLFTEQLIASTTNKIEKEISAALNPIAKEIRKIQNDRANNSFNYKDEIGLNSYFIPILSKLKNLSSIKYFDKDGRQYLLFKDKRTYVSAYRIEKSFNNEVVWKRWENSTKEISQWKETVENDPVRINWTKYFEENARTDSVFWFNLKGINNFSKGHIDAVTFGKPDSTNKLFGLALGIKTNSLTASISQLKLFSNPKLFLLNHNNHILPIITDNSDASREIDREFTLDNFKDSIVVAFIDNWNELGRDSVSFALALNSERWWAEVNPINLYKSKIQLGVIVSENDLIYAYLFDTYVIVGFLFIIFVIITIIFVRRRYRNKPTSGNRLTLEELNKFLKDGESEIFELKSSLRWDYNQEGVNKKLENVILKSISAFNNAKGGYLVIGIDDDNNTLGLEKDYASLKKHNSDYFELHLRNLINTAFTVRYTARKILISFLTIENKEICIIKISKGEYPLFLKTIDKNGRKIEKFYIRSGNSSQEITTLSEINNYIDVRFKSDK